MSYKPNDTQDRRQSDSSFASTTPSPPSDDILPHTPRSDLETLPTISCYAKSTTQTACANEIYDHVLTVAIQKQTEAIERQTKAVEKQIQIAEEQIGIVENVKATKIFSKWPEHDDYDNDPFIPTNPYGRVRSLSRAHRSSLQSPLPPSHWDSMRHYTDQAARLMCLIFLVGPPSMYLTRVRRVFDYAKLSRVEIDLMIDLGQSPDLGESNLDWEDTRGLKNPNALKKLTCLKRNWEELVDTMLREWNTLNVVAALVLSAILTIFQTDGGKEPITRTFALVSLMCALISLMYGCVYLTRFRTMKCMRQAFRWAEVTKRTDFFTVFSTGFFLALPLSTLSWSLASFITCILTFVWRTGTKDQPAHISNAAAITSRVLITFVFGLGLWFFFCVLVILSFFIPWDPHVVEEPVHISRGPTKDLPDTRYSIRLETGQGGELESLQGHVAPKRMSKWWWLSFSGRGEHVVS